MQKDMIAFAVDEAAIRQIWHLCDIALASLTDKAAVEQDILSRLRHELVIILRLNSLVKQEIAEIYTKDLNEKVKS